MPPSIIEAGIGDFHYAKQSALGTIAASNAAGTIRIRKVGDAALKSGKTFGREPYVDGQSVDDPNIYVDQIGGEVGTLPFQAQPETGGVMWAQAIGVDVVTGTNPDYTHTMALGVIQPPYGTWRQSVGQAIGPYREAYWDSKISKLVWNCGQDQKVAHMDATIMALKAGEVYSTTPTATDSGSDAWNWNEVAGEVKIDTVSFPEISGETIEFDRKLGVHRGDASAPVAIFPTKGSLLRTFNGVVTDTLLPKIKAAIWGSATPADGTLPDNTVSYVALATKYTRTATRSLEILTPKVAVSPADFEIGARDSGGLIPIVFGGDCKKNGGTAALTVIAKTADATAYC